MRKKVFNRIKDKLALLLVFFVIISMTATAVSAAYDIQHHPSGNQEDTTQVETKEDITQVETKEDITQVDSNLGKTTSTTGMTTNITTTTTTTMVFTIQIKWIYNPATLVRDWTYIPVPIEVQPAVPIGEVPTAVQSAVGDAIVTNENMCLTLTTILSL